MEDKVSKVLYNKSVIYDADGGATVRQTTEVLGSQVYYTYEGGIAKDPAALVKRGNQIWSHRQKASGYISGTVQYEVLKRAKYRCELCGISAELKALDVDHILPRKHGGTDDSSNLQALCYTCNRSKRDRDDTDFRGIADSYKERIRSGISAEEAEPIIESHVKNWTRKFYEKIEAAEVRPCNFISINWPISFKILKARAYIYLLGAYGKM